MAWYAYCIAEQKTFPNGRVRRPFAIENLTGINGAPIFGYPSGEFVVLVSEHSIGATLTQQSVLDHARVVSECFRDRTVLPFKFGTVFESDEALRQAVRGNKRSFTESVSRLRGKAEMHIKMIVPEALAEHIVSDAAAPKPGSEYLMQLREKASRDRERQSKARSLSVQVHKLFNPLEEEVTCKKVESGVLLDIAHLIDSKAVEKYQTRYNLAMRQFKDVQISLSGPWPPYHFTPGRRRAN
ncbi:MAG TPA: GvpL/GvpF family gas vesicle protein [Terriglobales bacterium]